MGNAPETFEFQTETRQLLDLMIHSVYSHKEIFLRELISNASDALDKRRFLAVTNPEAAPEGELHIRIDTDRDARTLSVSDNGIGMTRAEVTELIGTIARSGTREFLNALKAKNDTAMSPELIGQFGVGFYSSFMVADKVTLVTRKAGETVATQWESAGAGTYTLADAERPEAGTTVTLHLKPVDSDEGIEDFTNEWVIRRLVKKYSDFVDYPIRMECEKHSHEYDDEGKPKPGSEKTTRELETLNSMKAIWLRDPAEVSDDEYKEFYKHISHDWGDPLERIQAKIEGTLLYRLLLFIPSKAPFDMFSHDGAHGIHLYVRRVFIMDDCKVLLPLYLRFIRGVVDSEDLSLNISREMLQQDRQIQRIRKGLVNKVLDALRKMKDGDAEKYLAFWNEFGRVLKEGLFQDMENRTALLDLALCESTNSPDKLTTLKEYVERMKEDQKAIYYLTGESRATVENSPHLEAFRDRGIEVLLLTDPVDEVWTQSVFEFVGKRFQSVGKGVADLDADKDETGKPEERKEEEDRFKSLFECLQKKLDEHVKEVRVSSRLTSSPACLVGDDHDMSPQMAQMLRAMNQEVPTVKRVLEVNAHHPLLERLQAAFSANPDDPALDDQARLLYGLAVLAEGGQPPEPGRFSRLVADLAVKSFQ